jgi:mannose PTS system EIIA component
VGGTPSVHFTTAGDTNLSRLLSKNIDSIRFSLITYRKRMAKILVISHGLLAQELCNAVAVIMGFDNSLDCISMDVTQGIEQLNKDLAEKICDLLKTSDKLLIVCDLYFGSPFIAASKYVTNVLPPQRYRIITGANLPMLLELCTVNNSDPDNLDHLVDVALCMGREGIMEFVLKVETNTSDEII